MIVIKIIYNHHFLEYLPMNSKEQNESKVNLKAIISAQ